jgi:hypothetical protein
MTDILGIRQAVFTRRLTGGSNHIHWSAKDAARIRHHVFELPEKVLLGAATMKLLDSQQPVTASSAHILRAMDSSALSWQFQITNETPDLCLDSIKRDAWNFKNFEKNGPVLDCHNSAIPPLGQSSMPVPYGSSGMMATITFPQPGISAASDQARAMVAAGVLRGASVGFIPKEFRFSKDPARPMGIDFLSGHILTEWSIVSVPCHPLCVVVGPVGSERRSLFSTKYNEDQPRDSHGRWGGGGDPGGEALRNKLDELGPIGRLITSAHVGHVQAGVSGAVLGATLSAFVDSGAAKHVGLISVVKYGTKILPVWAKKLLFNLMGFQNGSKRRDASGADVDVSEATDDQIVEFFKGLSDSDAKRLASEILKDLSQNQKQNVLNVLLETEQSEAEDKSGSDRDVKMAARRREARALAARARSISASILPDVTTREGRLLEAKNFRRASDLAGRS